MTSGAAQLQEEIDMSSAEERIESELMPDWHRRKAVELDRIDWTPIAEIGQSRDPRAAQVEEIGY